VSQVKEQAEVLRHSLVAGCISRDDVVEWALSMVAEDDRPAGRSIHWRGDREVAVW